MSDPGLPLTTGEGNTAQNPDCDFIRRGDFNDCAHAGGGRGAKDGWCSSCVGRLREQLDAARQALTVYADARNWGIMRDEFRHPSCVWIGPGATDTVPNAPAVARAALGVEGPAG